MIDGGEIGQQDAAGPQGGGSGGDHLVGLGHIEEDAVQVPLIDALGHVPDLHPIGRIGAQGGGHVGSGPFGEVLPELVADDGGSSPEHRHGKGS